VMVTRKGVIKKTKLEEFANVRRNASTRSTSRGDDLLAVDLSDGSRDIILASGQGMAFTSTRKRASDGRGARASRR